MLAATALAVALAASAVGAPATTEPLLPTVIHVSLSAKKATMDKKSIERGSVVQFKIRNATPQKRLFTIGGQKVIVKPKGFEILLIAFDARGVYPFTSSSVATVHRGQLRVI